MRRKIDILLIAAVFIATFGSGLTVSAEPLKLSFREALEITQADNPRIQQARLNIDKAEAQIGEAYSAAMPSITALGYYQRNLVIPEMVSELPEEFGGGEMRFKFDQENLFRGQIELSQPLFVGGKVGFALQIAKLYREVTDEQLRQTESEVTMQITQLYFGAALADEWEKAVLETYEQMQAHLATAEQMYDQDLVSEYDVIRSRVQVSNFYPQLINAQTKRKVAYEALNIALDLPRDQALELTDHLGDQPISTLSVDDPFGIALQNRSEFRQIDMQGEMLDRLRKIEKRSVWWPNIALVGGYTATAQEPQFDVDDYYWMENLYAGITVSIPLFDGFKAHHRAQQVKVDRDLLGLQREQLTRGINLEILQARERLEQALKTVQAQEEGIVLARKGLEIAEVRYENGIGTHLEVIDAQVAFNQARTNELSARYDVITAHAELEKAMGNP